MRFSIHTGAKLDSAGISGGRAGPERKVKKRALTAEDWAASGGFIPLRAL
jgi:hypothetical protein